jgi:hypothetical protein
VLGPLAHGTLVLGGFSWALPSRHQLHATLDALSARWPEQMRRRTLVLEQLPNHFPGGRWRGSGGGGARTDAAIMPCCCHCGGPLHREASTLIAAQATFGATLRPCRTCRMDAISGPRA